MICSYCNKEFAKNSNSQIYCSEDCKYEVHKKKELQRYHAINKHSKKFKSRISKYQIQRRIDLASWIVDYKKACKCSDCGIADYRCLDFHHINPKEKDSSIARMITDRLSKDSILLEINKCIVLCSNCHRIHHSSLG